MLIDVNFDGNSQTSFIKFPIDQFEDQRQYHVAIAIIQTFSADFDLDPELEPEDLKEIISAVNEKKQNAFTVEISDDGIEVELS